jgi:cytochrome c-type biogenesis protein CcmE
MTNERLLLTLFDPVTRGPYPNTCMPNSVQAEPASKRPLTIILASILIVGVVVWLAVSAAGASKSYYVTISELNALGSRAYTRHLRVAGNVEPGSIHRSGTHAQFTLLELGRKLNVNYQGSEPPPDTFKDDAQALAIGTYGRDGVFHATQLQAKCASKYAPAPGSRPGQPTPAAKPSGSATAAAVIMR